VTATPTPRRPRIRFGTISWGLIVLGGATALLALLLTPGARSGFVEWVLELTPGTAIVIGMIILGGVVLLLGALAVIRGRQLRITSDLPTADSPSA
jgi:hypothetical protein